MNPNYTVSFKNQDARKDLFSLVKAQDLTTIKTLNLIMADLDQRDSQNLTALNYAILLNDQITLNYFYSLAERYFLESDQLLKKIDDKGRTLMHWAAKCNQDESILNKLIRLNFTVNDKIPQLQVTPLYLACQDGCVPAAQALIKLGADINAEIINGALPIHAAAENGNEKLIDALLNAGANINKPCHQGGTPLFIAAQKGHTVIVAKLIKAGSKVDMQIHDGASPLIVAAQYGYTDIMELLIAANADINLKTKTGITALQAAQQNNQEAAAKLLS